MMAHSISTQDAHRELFLIRMKGCIVEISLMCNKPNIEVLGALIENEIIVDEMADELSRFFGG